MDAWLQPVSYTHLEQMGKFYYQLEKSPIARIELTYAGPMTINDTEILTVAFFKGLLEPILWNKVNYVNARLMARERGIKVFESKQEQSSRRYKNVISVSIFGQNGRQLDLAGTVSRARDPLLVELNGYETETNLEGYVIMVENSDRPRVVGPFATLLGDEGVNIASMKAVSYTHLDVYKRQAQQYNLLCTAFHPELTQDLCIHRYFLTMV